MHEKTAAIAAVFLFIPEQIRSKGNYYWIIRRSQREIVMYWLPAIDLAWAGRSLGSALKRKPAKTR